MLWTFTIPWMLRPYFLRHRELLGELCWAGRKVARQLMVTATQRPDLQPGIVAVVHTAGDFLGWRLHVHTIASSGIQRFEIESAILARLARDATVRWKELR